ncbi:phosphate ABC transporter, permease PstA [Firmicutes bacterium M10-2]|nr:phosphate ABC transporter, permease PstA [Firmicutes bacterium M10-2]
MNKEIHIQKTVEIAKKKKKKSTHSIASVLVWASALLVVAVGIGIVIYIMIQGVPYLNSSLFEWNYSSENVSMLPALINTIFMLILSLLIALPIGIAGSIYLVEYAKKSNPFIRIVNLMIDTLSGIPSIVYGLFGSLFFVKFFGMGLSLLSGALTLSIMILPIIMNTTQEALREVPMSMREGSYGLGAGKLHTILHVVLPSSLGGIISGAILAAGRIFGESAALIFTAGTLAAVSGNIMDPARTMAVHLYALSQEGLYIHETYASSAVLIIVVLIMNGLAGLIKKCSERNTIHG